MNTNGNGKKQSQDIDLMKLMERFHSDDKCRTYLEQLRWPKGVQCPRCGSRKISRIYTRNQFDCESCGYQFSVTSGTVFQDSHLPLSKWFATIYLMIEAKKGVSANQIKRTMGVSYKTSWYLCHRIRASMKEAYPYPLRDIVEVDEAWIGGKVKGRGHGYRGNKAVVVGAAQRGGKIVLQVVSGTDRETLHKFIKENTAPDTKAIYTDDWPAYRGIADEDTRQ